MAISAVRRPSTAGIQTWMAANWPVAVWLSVAVVITIAGSRNARETYRQMVAMTDVPVPDRAELQRSLANLRLSPVFIAWFEMASVVLGTIVNMIVGWLLIRRPPRTGFACYLAFVLLALTEADYPPDIASQWPDQPVTQTIIRICTIVAISGLFILPFIFPTGRFVPRWTVLWGIYCVYTVTAFAFFHDGDPLGQTAPVAVQVTSTVALVASAAGSMIYRYLKISTTEQRRQTRWAIFGLMISLPAFFIGDATMRSIDASPIGIFALIVFLVIMPIAMTLPTITLGIAILRHNLFDIDVILGRTLVWVLMTAAVTATYVSVVLGVGGLIGSRGSLLLSLLATGLVAVGFQPLRLHVQRLVNHLLFGDRDDPYAVLTRLGQHVEDTLSASDLLPAIVRTTAEMLRLPYVALFLERAEGPVLVASTGLSASPTLRLPLTYQGQTIGALEVATRSPGEVFGEVDRRLLEDLARQIGVAARTVSLAEALQQSRERIVTSREEERRRLRRDLHDGLGAQLAALMLQVSRTRSLLRTDVEAADRKLSELGEELRSAVTDIRRLVQGLRPPALDELGLVGTVQARLSRLDGIAAQRDPPAVRAQLIVEEPLPPLSAAIEVAALRIIEEAITNVVKHAAATKVVVTLRMRDDYLLISVEDDGIGVSSPGGSAGLGLHSMRERATELGGTCVVGPTASGRGTLVQVSVPAVQGTGGETE